MCTTLINIHFVPEFHFFLYELFDWENCICILIVVANCPNERIASIHHAPFMSIDYYLTFLFSLFMLLPSLLPISISIQSLCTLSASISKEHRTENRLISLLTMYRLTNMKYEGGQIDEIKVKCRERKEKLRQANTVCVVSSDWFLWHSRFHLCFIHRWLSIATMQCVCINVELYSNDS